MMDDDKMPFSKYSYKTLTHSSEIRLLRLPLNTAQPADLQTFALEHVLLDSRPKYYAVSYTWGIEAPKIPLVLNQDSSLRITENLWAGIAEFGQRYPGRYLWIDQICINQASKREKSAQVNMMTRIYALSECTVVWLGEPDGSTKALFEMVNYLGHLNLSVERRSFSHQELRQILARKHGSDLLPPAKDERWNALMRIFQRPWFCRLWTLQEVVVASNVLFFCGPHNCTQKDLVQAALLIGREYPFEERWTNGISTCIVVDRYRTSYHEHLGLPLLELLLYTVQKFRCKEPYDKVFALLGLQSNDLRLPIHADYETSVTDTYTHFAKVMIKESSSLQILTLRSSRSGTIEGLPLWTPDWSTPTQAATLDWLDPKAFRFHASGSFQYRDVMTDSPRVAKQLLVAGRIKDRVQMTINIEFEAYSPPGTHLQCFERLMSECLKTIRLRYEGRTLPPNFETDTLLKLVRTLLVDGFVRVFRFRGHDWPETDWMDQKILEMLERLAIVRSNSGPEAPPLDSDLEKWLSKLDSQLELCCGRRIVVLENNKLGLCPNQSQPGDFICILHGVNIPLVLREHTPEFKIVGPDNYGLTYELIGPCFVDGIMYGEAVDWKEDEADIFTLI